MLLPYNENFITNGFVCAFIIDCVPYNILFGVITVCTVVQYSVRVVRKGSGNGQFRGAAAEKPLNRFT